MWLASKLDVPFYEMVEGDPRYTREAFFVVLLVALLSGIGAAATAGASIADLFLGFLGAILGWVAWANTLDAETASVADAKSDATLFSFFMIPLSREGAVVSAIRPN